MIVSDSDESPFCPLRMLSFVRTSSSLVSSSVGMMAVFVVVNDDARTYDSIVQVGGVRVKMHAST